MSYADRLAAYIAAEAKILAGQEVAIAGRTLRRPDLNFVRQEIRYLQTMASRESNGSVLSVSAANTRGR